MSIVSKRLHIGGMICVNCENKIEQKLQNTAGIQKVAVSYNTGTADITYDSDVITLMDIQTIIEKLDYEVLQDTQKETADVWQMISILTIILSLYQLFQQFGILNLLVPGQLAETKMGYGMLFLVGIITSVHCIAMCGGINLSQCITTVKNEDMTKSKRLAYQPAFLYNFGRVISYTVIGFVLGLIGMLFGSVKGVGVPVLFQGILKIIAGIVMVIMGINMLGIFPWLKRWNPGIPWAIVAGITKKRLKSRQPFIVGLLNGLMPCGPLQAMQIVALASGNPIAGAFSMFLFSLGTVPLMLGFGSLVSALGKKFSKKVMNVGAILVVVLGLAMLSQGGSLSGLLLPDRLWALIILLSISVVIFSIPFRNIWHRCVAIFVVALTLFGGATAANDRNIKYSSGEITVATDLATVVDGVQVVNSTLASGKYPDITVQAGIPVKWIIDAPEGSINGCNYKMLLKAYGMEHEFTEGENIIEFTPDKAETISYTCWMGMIRGNIFVE